MRINWWWRTFAVVTVHGDSMLPTYRPGDRVLIRRLPGSQVRAGQVVVLELSVLHGAPAPNPDLPLNARHWAIKRVAAVAGDRLYVLGDNASASHDSRRAGAVPAGAVLGVVVRHLTASSST